MVEGMNWNPSRLSFFGEACYRGQLETVVGICSSGEAPPLNGFETPFHWGYLSIVIFGAQRCRTVQSESFRHLECLEFLLSHGAPPDLKDIVGYTALHHACISPTTSEQYEPVNLDPSRPIDAETRAKIIQVQTHLPELSKIAPLIRTLIKYGANILLENGASLDIAEAEGLTPRSSFVRYGPQMTACVTKWIRKREGINAPREEQAWKTHKKICKPFNISTTIVLKPSYGENLKHLQSIANLTRNFLGIEQDLTPKSRPRTGHVPRKPGKEFESKNLIVKVQVALSSYATTIQGRHSFDKSGDLLVYDKRREFICTIKRSEQGNGTSSAEVCGGEKAFDKLVEVVQEKGIGGSKAYFAAVLKSEKELVIKVEDVLAEQPF
ncbi:hypothetical protein BDP27DRAFT_1420312 [Rhodocollybia butyracea]|uniref:Uncharacterized protein n=1 Tax=Rhodocollybia butyracea TaxID=206335 RepID=A0A9P5PVJ3_9AGAR|nr:hypothetical protein BDP27DRAFT_1420312 [Rhodocollybia butyracea]